MDRDLERNLIDELLKQPASRTFNGRTALHAGLEVDRRDEHSAHDDLALILGQLAHRSPQAILIVLANAEANVRGTDLEQGLAALEARTNAWLAAHPGESPFPLPGAPFLVPFPRNPRFVGRDDDLARLHELLQKGGAPGVRPVMLAGLGGAGKTQMAVEYAYRHQADYAGGVYWVDAARDWQAELASQAERAGLLAGDGPDSERVMRLARMFSGYLDAHPDALIVFDNVADPRTLRTPAPGFIPSELKCRVLITTRRRDQDLPFAIFEVGGLSDGAALHLLLGGEARKGLLAGNDGPELDAARSICRSLGYLPLAITLAASFLDKHPALSLSGYLKRLGREGGLAVVDKSGVDPLDLATRHEAAVAATLKSQWEALDSADARLALQAAALLGESAPVPRAQLALLTGLPDRAGEGEAPPLDDALLALDGLSLLEKRTAEEIRLHPLVREFAQTKIDGREAFAAACAARLVEALWDMGRLHAEVAARGVYAVLGDLRTGSQLAGASGQARLEALMRPLDREAHALRGWDPAKAPGFFLQQLRNRCFEMGIEEVRERAEAKLGEQRWSWLRERIRTSRESEALVRTLEGHTNTVRGVAVTEDGRFAVSASQDKTLKVWDLGTGLVVRTLEGHTNTVYGVALTEDGRFAVSASQDKTLKVWDLGTGQVVRSLAGHTYGVMGVAVTADGRFAVSASWDKTLKVWDLGTGQAVRSLEGHTYGVMGVAVTADGRFAVSASLDKTLKVWDLGTGQAVRSLEGHTNAVYGVAVTEDGRFAVSASADKTLKVWDLGTGQAVRSLEGHTSWVYGVAVTEDGRFAVSASQDTTLKVWDLGTGQAVRSLEGHANVVFGVAVTADGRFAVSASADKTLKLWDLGTEQVVRSLETHTSRVYGGAVTGDGRFAVSASWDTTLKVWDLGTGQAVRSLEGHTAGVTDVAVTADGRFAVSASWDKTLKVWDLGTGQAIRSLEGHTYAVAGVAVTGDGRFAVSASRDKTLKVWDLGTGQAIRSLEGHTFGVTRVAVTADGRFAVSAAQDTTLKVWDLGTGRAVRSLEGHTGEVTGVALTADGRFAVSAAQDTTLKVWDLGTGRAVRSLEGHTGEVTGVAVTADGRFAVSTSWDRTLKVWDLGTGQPVTTLKPYAPFQCCTIAPHGRTILAGDNTSSDPHILDWLPLPTR
jgi:WD40 repeat protein